LKLIAEIDEFKGAWRALGRIAPERLTRLRHVATIESVGSSTRIEGAQLTDREVEALLSRVKGQRLATRDEQEVAGYAAVIDLILSSFGAIGITENHIKQMHATLLQHSGKDERHRGEYKKTPNRVEAFDESGKSLGVVFEPASPFDTPREMKELIEWYDDSKGLHPLIAIGVFVVVFLAIHPFQDGNGRLSRALTTLLLLRAGYAFIPYCSLENVIEQQRDAYYLALRRTQGTLRSGQIDWSPWMTFFLRTLREHTRRLEAKIEREQIMRAAISELAVRVLELAQEHGEVSVADVVQLTGSPRATVKKWVSVLSREGKLQRLGKGRGTRYAPA